MNQRLLHLRVITLWLLLAIPAVAGAQTFKQWSVLGEQAITDGQYLDAALYFGEAYELDSTQFEITIRYADALRLSRNYVEARRLYKKAYDKDKGRLYPEGQYYLAQMQMLAGDYAEALKNFTRYEKRLKRDKASLAYQKIQQEIASCSLALTARMPDRDMALQLLPGDVNTEKSEFAPYLVDSTLYYTRSEANTGRISLRVADQQEEEFSNARAMAGEFDLAIDYGNLCFSPDRSRAYFTACENGLCAIYEAQFSNGKLRDPKSIPTLNQSDITSTMPYIGLYRDQEVLYFASDRKGTRGGLDIWWSLRNDDGSWDPPVNAGDNVNTPGNEISPYHSGEHLYFSSDWHPGFGGFDIFRSKGYPRSFDLPENLDRPLNSSLNDLYYRYFPDQTTGIFASNRDGSLADGSFCCNDLYSVQFADSLKAPEAEPDIFTSLEQLNDYLPVTLYFHNDEPDPRTRATTTQRSYDETADDYLALRQQYQKEMGKGLRSEDREDSDFEVDEFFTFYVEKGLRNLENFADLLLIELEKGYSIQLSIKGFASPRAKSDYNVNLTSRRISSLVNYLKRTKNGAFMPFIDARADNHATLTFEEIPFGEYRADATVSDELDDRQSSVYARGARLERKIEILSVERGSPDSLFAQAEFNTRIVDFGKIASDRQVENTLILRSVGTDTLVVDSILAPCGCTVPELDRYRLPPGLETELHIAFNPQNLTGIVTRKVLVFIRGREEPIEITIAAEVSDSE